MHVRTELLSTPREARPARRWTLAQGPLIVSTRAWVSGGGTERPSNLSAQEVIRGSRPVFPPTSKTGHRAAPLSGRCFGRET